MRNPWTVYNLIVQKQYGSRTAESSELSKRMQGPTDDRFGPNFEKGNVGIRGPPTRSKILNGERRDPRTADLV